MPAGQYTPLSRLRQSLAGHPEGALALECIDQALRIIRGAPDDKKRLLKAPVERTRLILESLSTDRRETALARFEAILESAQAEAKAKSLARNKEVYRTRVHDVAKAREETLAEAEARHKVAMDQAQAEIQRLRALLKTFTGPGHIPPANATTITSKVARPPITATHWKDEGWSCLRVEERTVGHFREQAYSGLNGAPALRLDPRSNKWMGWMRGLASEFGLLPTDKQVRMVFFPGLAYTFIAWVEVAPRPKERLHPMDPDNAVKSTADALQTTPDKGEKVEHGAYVNDTLVVDQLVYRLPQGGTPPVDRIALASAKKRRKVRAPGSAPKPKRVCPKCGMRPFVMDKHCRHCGTLISVTEKESDLGADRSK